MSERFDALLRGLAARLGADGGDAALSGLRIDGLEVLFRPDPDGRQAVMYVRLGDLSGAGADVARSVMLSANCFFQGTGKSTLAEEGGGAYLQRGLDLVLAERSPEYFEEELESFVNIAEYWRGVLSRLAADGGEALSGEGREYGERV